MSFSSDYIDDHVKRAIEAKGYEGFTPWFKWWTFPTYRNIRVVADLFMVAEEVLNEHHFQENEI